MICLTLLTKKWECPNKIAVEGGWEVEGWAKLLPLAHEGFAEICFLLYNLSEKKPDSIPEGAK
ncbi:MAG: hypothetical protein ACRCVU_06765 [Flavobacterium sp.]